MAKKTEQPFFLFLGVLRNYKGVDTLLKAARGLNSKLVIAGDGPEFASLKSNAVALGLENVYFTGRITEDDKAALLELCQGLVLPSHLRSEAFGLVQLEAAMRSKPLICTELGTGTSFVNEHENTGLVVPPKNVDALRNAMNFMVYHPKIAARMGEEAHSRFTELFWPSACAMNILASIMKLSPTINKTGFDRLERRQIFLDNNFFAKFFLGDCSAS